jgi:hypothetical protein
VVDGGRRFFDHEMVAENSPGLLALGGATPQDRPESGDRMCGVESRLEVMNGGTVCDGRAGRNGPLGRRFQGGLRTCLPRAKANKR